jgi:UDP-N-acetylmuramyl pentapeptide phosphotransferase/UDP-N-acetylglucosamine-1-phosphate transferase
MLDPQLYQLILSFSWAFLISVFAIPSIIYVAHIKNLLDEPNKRTIHESLTPRLGGLAIFAGFMSALTIFGQVTFGVKELLAGAIIIFFIGLKDDIVTVSAFKKFFVQVLASGIIMFMADIRIRDFHGLFGVYQLEDGISYAFTFLVIIGITNAINLIDGLDGLAGTIVLIATASLGFYFFHYGQENYAPYADVAFCLLGSILGFLRYNLHKAIIFMGDTGSLVCGFIVSVLAIQFVEMKPVVNGSPTIAIAILIIPILDTIRVFLLRILAGTSPFSPDKNHIHHRLVSLGLSQLATVIVLAKINLLAIFIAVYFSYLGNNNVLLILIGFGLLFSIIIEVAGKKVKNEVKV